MRFGFLARPGAQKSGKKIGQETENSRPIIIQELWPGFQSEHTKLFILYKKIAPCQAD
jgi:hypothetical protein